LVELKVVLKDNIKTFFEEKEKTGTG